MGDGDRSPGVPTEMDAAVIQRGGRVEVTRVPVPTVGDDGVLVAVEVCGVCGTDLHMVLEGWGRPGTWGGHEWTGTVVAVGSDVDRWRVGDAVVGGPPAGCSTCAMCRAGRTSLCVGRDAPGREDPAGAFATYARARPDELLARPEDMAPRVAALAEPLAVALHAIAQGQVQGTDAVMVMGAGPIGALAVAALAARGVERIVCVEPTPGRGALARTVGATEVLGPEALEVPSIAEPGRIVEGAVDVVLECSGRRTAMEAGLAQLGRRGTLVLVGAGMDAPQLDPNRILLNELTVTGAFNHDPDGFPSALALLGSGRLPVEDLIEPGVVGLDGLQAALEGLAAGDVAGKVMVRP